jgi:hypothetical protein
MTGRWTGRGLCMTGRVRSVFSVCAVFSLMIGRAARPVTDDRTRPVSTGAYWNATGRGHCRVRSIGSARPVTATASSDTHCFLLSCSDRTRPVTLTGASGQCVFRCVVCNG